MICVYIHYIYYKVLNVVCYFCNVCALNRDIHKISHTKLPHPSLNILIFVIKKNIL